jgi:hypothetical protein
LRSPVEQAQVEEEKENGESLGPRPEHPTDCVSAAKYFRGIASSSTYLSRVSTSSLLIERSLSRNVDLSCLSPIVPGIRQLGNHRRASIFVERGGPAAGVCGGADSTKMVLEASAQCDDGEVRCTYRA